MCVSGLTKIRATPVHTVPGLVIEFKCVDGFDGGVGGGETAADIGPRPPLMAMCVWWIGDGSRRVRVVDQKRSTTTQNDGRVS